MQHAYQLSCGTPHDVRAKYLINFLYSIENLKQNRSIWKIREIDRADNTLEHTEKILIAANLFGENNPEYNYYALQDKAIVHDYLGNMSGLENIFFEKTNMEQLCKCLPYSIGSYAYKIWLDFRLQKTKEDSIIHQLDVLDPAILAFDIEQRSPYHELMLSDLFPEVEKELKHPLLKKIFNYMQEREYPEIGSFAQYMGLLKLNGDIDKFRMHADKALTTPVTQQILFNHEN